jgi:hypothetical protein
MNPEPSSRHGVRHHDRRGIAEKYTLRRSSRHGWLRRVGYALILSLVVLVDVVSNMPIVAAASHTPAMEPRRSRSMPLDWRSISINIRDREAAPLIRATPITTA